MLEEPAIWMVIAFIIAAVIVYTGRPTNHEKRSRNSMVGSQPTDVASVVPTTNAAAFSGESAQSIAFLGRKTKELSSDGADAFRKNAENAEITVRKSGVHE